MRMCLHPARLLRTSLGTLVLGLITFALMLRALVPTGFMVDIRQSGAPLMITFCTADGATLSMPVDLPASGAHSDKDAPSSADCPFGSLVGHAILRDAAPVVLAQGQAYTRVLVPAYRAAPALPPAGPPLGSRAPPPHLV